MKRILSIFLTVAMLLTFCSIAVSATETPEGTAIRSAAALKRMEPTGTYYLASDVVIHGSWRFDEFRGTLDGNGHTIYFDHATVAGGLFAKLGGAEGATATIKNLNIVQLDEVTYTPANEGIGALAGSADLGDTISVENVKVYANITNAVEGTALGGLIGDARYCSLIMKRCVFSGTLNQTAGGDASKTSTGGMLGKTWSTVSKLHFVECVNYGDLTAVARVSGMFGYDFPKSDSECIKELVIDKCVNYGKITGTLDHTDNSGVGGLLGHHIAYANTTTQLTHNVNYGDIRSTQLNTLGSIAGQVQVARANQDATTLKVEGNVNYGTVKTYDETKLGVGMIAFWRTTTGGGISEHSKRVHNYHNDGIAAHDTPESFGQKTNHRFTGIDFTDSAATFALLDSAYPNTYVLNSDGKIVLKWTVDAGYNADFAIRIPTLEEIETGANGVDKTPALTLDITVPEATGTPISSQDELKAIEATGTYYLTKDILITGEFKGIENFSGVLHGNGHTIVLNGAELRGGLIANLAGGKIYNLSITEEKVDDPQENSYRALMLNDTTLCFGTVAGYGYGTLVNVTSDCAVGGSMKYSTNGYVGGLIGVLTDGDSVIYNCRNLAKVQGGYAGGLIGFLSGGEGKVEISRCHNWGEVVSSSGAAGGIVGIHAASVIRLLMLENVNYGAISTTASAYCGGIIGSHKNIWDGVSYFLNNVNYGTVTCNYTDADQASGCPGGIMGYFDADSYAGATISGNINYGEVVGNKAPNQLVAVAENNDGVTTAENNFAAAGSVAATVGTVAGTTVDANTLNTLNTAYSNAYVMQGEEIHFKWEADQGLSATAPTVSYSFGTETVDPGTNGDETEQVTTEPTGTTNTTEEPKKGGCKSAVSGLGLVMMLTVVCGAGFLATKKNRE